MDLLLAYARAKQKNIIALIRQLVECESPSADLDAVRRSADLVEHLGTARLGVPPERVVIEGCSHLRWRFEETHGDLNRFPGTFERAMHLFDSEARRWRTI